MTIDEYNIVLRHQQKAPVNIIALATDLGLRIFKSSLLPQGISGKITRDPHSSSGYKITFNARDADRRQRFTIAHECAHYLLHRSKFGNELLDDTMYRSEQLTSQEEFDANNKAADLLMPRHLVDSYRKRGYESPSALADVFQVSEAAMKVRLRYLYWQN